MAKDNLLLFQKKSTSVTGMNEKQLKWLITGTLAVILALSVGLNGALFAPPQNRQVTELEGRGQRGIASLSPVVNIAWEKRAFEVLKNADSRAVASIGKKPEPYDELSFGVLEGNYAIRLLGGRISEIQFANGHDTEPKVIGDRQQFLNNFRQLFKGDAALVTPTSSESSNEMVLEKYQLASTNGQVLATVEFRLDSHERLLSLTVQ